MYSKTDLNCLWSSTSPTYSMIKVSCITTNKYINAGLSWICFSEYNDNVHITNVSITVPTSSAYFLQKLQYIGTNTKNRGIFWIFKKLYFIQHCFICRPSDSTVSEDVGIEPRNVTTSALAVRRSNHSTRSHPHSARSHPSTNTRYACVGC